jgi:hypothetical protein
MSSYTSILENFTIDTLPDLDTVALGALELFEGTDVPDVDLYRFKRPLVVGSGNAAITGRLLFDDVDAVFADESTYVEKLTSIPSIDGAFLISASGSKHAIPIMERLTQADIPVALLTNTPDSPASAFLPPENVFVFPKNREPYTYNTSTYMGMLFSKTHENPGRIRAFIESTVIPAIPEDLASHSAFFFILPQRFSEMRGMFQTKFDELFGPMIVGRIFTLEQTKHAKTVIPHPSELFVSFGEENAVFGDPARRLTIPLPEDCDYAGMMAIAYVFIGHIQRQLTPWYKERIAAYAKETSTAFGTKIDPIVS